MAAETDLLCIAIAQTYWYYPAARQQGRRRRHGPGQAFEALKVRV